MEVGEAFNQGGTYTLLVGIPLPINDIKGIRWDI